MSDSFLFCTFSVSKNLWEKVPMEIPINKTAVEGQEQGGGKPANDLGACQQDAHEDTVYEALMRRMAERCRTMESYAQAEPLLMELMMMAVKDGGATGLMVEMVDGVKNFFAEKNKPKPQVVYKDCTLAELFRELVSRKRYVTLPDGESIWVMVNARFWEKEGNREFGNDRLRSTSMPTGSKDAIDLMVKVLNPDLPLESLRELMQGQR